MGKYYGATGKSGAPLLHVQTKMKSNLKPRDDRNTVDMLGLRVYNGDIMQLYKNGVKPAKMPSNLLVLADQPGFEPKNNFVSRCSGATSFMFIQCLPCCVQRRFMSFFS